MTRHFPNEACVPRCNHGSLDNLEFASSDAFGDDSFGEPPPSAVTVSKDMVKLRGGVVQHEAKVSREQT